MTSVGKQWFDIRNQILGNNREAVTKTGHVRAYEMDNGRNEEMHSTIIVPFRINASRKVLSKRKLRNQSSSCVGKFYRVLSGVRLIKPRPDPTKANSNCFD